MTKHKESRLRIAKRMAWRMGGIYGPITSRELEEFHNHPGIVKIIKTERLRWAGHVKGQEESQRLVKLGSG